MHLNGELDPRGFIKPFSVLSNVEEADIALDESVLTSWTIASKFLYWTKNKDYLWYIDIPQ